MPVARRESQLALFFWLAALLLMLGATAAVLTILPAWSPFSPSDWMRLRAISTVAVPITASWLFASLFDLRLLGRGLRLAIRTTPQAGTLLIAALLIAPASILAELTAAAVVLCACPTLFGTIFLQRASGGRALRLLAFGWIPLCTAIAVGQSMQPPTVLLMAIEVGAALAAAVLWCGAVVDVEIDRSSKRDQSHAKAVDAARKYRHVYYSVPIALISIDARGQVLRWNEMAERAFGAALAPGRVNQISTVIGDAATDALLRDVRQTGRHRSELNLALEADRQTYAVDAIVAGTDIELSFADVSERSRLTATMEHLAHHDYLTRSLNRRGLERALDALLPDIAAGREVALVYIDLDRFKSINDVFGHAAGDGIVLEVARRLAEQTPEFAHIGRIGGDEFVVVLPDHTLDDAKTQATQLLNALARESIEFEGLQLNVEASIGVIAASPGMQTRELLAYADEACAESKRQGRGRITALETGDDLLVNYRAEKRYGTQLKFRLPTERMRIFAQPIVPLLSDSDVMSYEVLLRTEDENGTIETPARLISAAERQGAMSAIDRFVLERTVEHLSQNAEHARALGFVAVNLSGMSLNDERFVGNALALLREHRQIASKICLEITESVALYDIGSTRRFVDEMRSIGASIALDDFGAGYTSFAYLKDLPASLLKIDGQFITGLLNGAKNKAIVRAIQQVGRELGMRCLAEWIEDEATLRALVDLEIDYGQGFVFSKARPIEFWLRERVDLSPLMAGQACA